MNSSHAILLVSVLGLIGILAMGMVGTIVGDVVVYQPPTKPSAVHVVPPPEPTTGPDYGIVPPDFDIHPLRELRPTCYCSEDMYAAFICTKYSIPVALPAVEHDEYFTSSTRAPVIMGQGLPDQGTEVRTFCIALYEEQSLQPCSTDSDCVGFCRGAAYARSFGSKVWRQCLDVARLWGCKLESRGFGLNREIIAGRYPDDNNAPVTSKSRCRAYLWPELREYEKHPSY